FPLLYFYAVTGKAQSLVAFSAGADWLAGEGENKDRRRTSHEFIHKTSALSMALCRYRTRAVSSGHGEAMR
ncbi:MAG TPA: hypothetical protein VIZ18_05025, partial [Ktedonobacteraceae bacterium]